MKKIKAFIGLICALITLFTASAFAACTDKPTHENGAFSSETLPENSIEGSEDPPQTEETPPEPLPPESSPETEPAPIIKTASYIKCTGENVNIRSGASTSTTVLGSAEKGTMYAVIEKKGNWYKTYYRNKTAYIYASYASVFSLEKTSDENVENVIEEGYKLLGVPYVYGAVRLHDGKGKLLGGFTAQKFDCSSLIQYIFYKGADVLLNVNTRTQVKQGEYVAKKDLQRGDCIFFTNEDRQYNTGIERIGHVALYLGDNYILHTSSDYARIEKMTAKRWGYYVEARRFL